MTTIRRPRPRPARDNAPRVVVAGAGFGGLAAVRALAHAGMQVTLIDRNIYATFQPLLYQVATAGLAGSDIAYPLRTITRTYGAVFRHGELAGIDPAARQVTLADGTVLPSDITVWAAGVAAPEAVRRWGLPQGPGGRLLTRPDLRVTGQDRIFAVGDIALTDGQPLPQLAQPALQMGTHAAAQIHRLAQDKATVPFAYRDKGTMATIGYRSAVVQLPHRVRIRGTAAWLAWLGLHLITLLGGRNRITTLVNLSWRYLTWRHGGGLIIGDQPPAVPAAPHEPAGHPAADAAGTDPAGTGPRLIHAPGQQHKERTTS